MMALDFRGSVMVVYLPSGFPFKAPWAGGANHESALRIVCNDDALAQ